MHKKGCLKSVKKWVGLKEYVGILRRLLIMHKNGCLKSVKKWVGHKEYVGILRR